MSNPTIPPEAVIAAYNAPSCGGSPGSTARNGVCGEYGCEACLKAILAAAYPHLRRAILAEVVPFMEHRPDCNRRNQAGWDEAEAALADCPDDPGKFAAYDQVAVGRTRCTCGLASILAALEKGENHQPGGTDDRG